MSRVRKRERADDKERLRLFVQRADWVMDHSLVKARVQASFNIHWERGGPVTWSSQAPNDESLESLTGRIRRFLPGDSELNLFRVHNICAQRLQHVEMRAFLATVRAEWAAAQRRGILALRLDERDVRPDHVADLMINGWYLHDDAAKAAELESLVGGLRLLTDHLFVGYVYSTVEAVFSTADVVRIGLERDMFD